MAKAKSIMIQGTMSNVGKSVLVAALCRIFKQDGYNVAPFKSQNMALNSFITHDGLEMGRAQVMQAEAAGIEPDVSMNPILLKPTNDTGSQVIVNGEVKETMSAWDYYEKKDRLIPDILNAYHYLEQKYEIIVIEGAGSPAEINLNKNDIVNMGMAKMANSPVLLAGDIDRGGVFAQLIGTLDLLTNEERSYVKGLLINKFRGDKNILMPGIEMLEQKAGTQVLGVIPYLDMDIDEEDSLSERFKKDKSIGLVDIAVIRLPRISNYTDFNAFECVTDVSLRYVTNPSELGDPDIIIIPGTKNTIDDLFWLSKNGLKTKILEHAKKGKIIFGVCGGYQMLGETISAPEGIECKGKIKGLGLLPINTVFKKEKTRTIVKGRFNEIKGILKGLSNKEFEGYEIHMGVSELKGEADIMSELKDSKNIKKKDGVFKENIYGTYVHGIFDKEIIVKTIISAVLKKKGCSTDKIMAYNMKEYKEKQYNMIAEEIRNSLDMKSIYQILDIGMD